MAQMLLAKADLLLFQVGQTQMGLVRQWNIHFGLESLQAVQQRRHGARGLCGLLFAHWDLGAGALSPDGGSGHCAGYHWKRWSDFGCGLRIGLGCIHIRGF